MDTSGNQLPAFEPPGPGPWDLDPLHFPRPVTAYWAEMHPEPFRLGYGDMTAFYGVPVQSRVTAYVNGFCYGQTQPLADDEFPDRVRRAAETFERKLWRDSAHEWEAVRRPASEKANRELQAIDPDQLSDDELVAHLRRCRANHASMIRQHMAFTGTAVISPGDFLAHAKQWTGLSTVKLLGLMRGASKVSGGHSPQHAALVAAYRADPVAREGLDADEDAGELLERLRREPSATGAALNDYLDLVGYRLLDGFDISNKCALELPDVLLRSIRTAIDESTVVSDLDQQVAEVRSLVPPEYWEEYDGLLAEARVGYSVRDERGVYGDIWASGLMRRAAMAAGRRLAERGRLHDPEDLVFADIDEMCAAVEGAPTPSADELAARHSYHRTYTAKDAPAHLGDEPPPMPDPSTLPPPMARLMAAIGTAMGEMFAVSEEEHEDTVIRGLGASSGQREGIARRVAGVESRQWVLVEEPAVEASEAGARTLGITYWQAVDQFTRGGVRASWTGDGGKLKLLGGATLLTFGSAELVFDSELVSCRYAIEGGLLALRAGGSVMLAQRREGDLQELSVTVEGYLPRLAARGGAPEWTGFLYAKGQSPFHAAVSRRYFDLLQRGRES